MEVLFTFIILGAALGLMAYLLNKSRNAKRGSGGSKPANPDIKKQK